MNCFKCPACGGEQYTAKDTAKGCIFCNVRKARERKDERLARL